MDEHDPILLKIDKLIRLSRLKEIEFIMDTDAAERQDEIRAALERLHGGAYLLGTGPSTVGIVSLNTDEIVLGRPPTIIEEPSDCGADTYAADTLFFVPREVSRSHAKVIRQTTDHGVRHIVIDLDSTCGTFVNEARLEPGGAVLAQADVISLGPSQTSTYVYYRTEPPAHPDADDPDRSAASWVWLPDSDEDS